MPIENEFNYVLSDRKGELRDRLARVPGVQVNEMVQAYLNPETRIRSFTDVRTGEEEFVFSFKRKVAGRVREIEQSLSREDFEALLPTAERSLRKTRYAFEENGVHWDVDYFHGRKGVYFVKAEAEVSEDIQIAPRPCETIREHVLFEAGKQSGFSSRRLCDEQYAKELMRIVKQHVKRKADREHGLDGDIGLLPKAA